METLKVFVKDKNGQTLAGFRWIADALDYCSEKHGLDIKIWSGGALVWEQDVDGLLSSLDTNRVGLIERRIAAHAANFQARPVGRRPRIKPGAAAVALLLLFASCTHTEPLAVGSGIVGPKTGKSVRMDILGLIQLLPAERGGIRDACTRGGIDTVGTGEIQYTRTFIVNAATTIITGR